MKKISFFIVAILFISIQAFSQRKNLIKLDIHSPVFRTGIITYERVLDKNSSLSLGVLYTSQTEGITNADYLTRVAITPEYRFYLSRKDAPHGFYASAFARYQWMQAQQATTWYDEYYAPQYGYTQRELSTFGGGITLGFQEIFKDRIVIDAYLGTVLNSGDKRRDLSNPYSSEPNTIFKPYVGYFIRSGVNVGFAF